MKNTRAEEKISYSSDCGRIARDERFRTPPKTLLQFFAALCLLLITQFAGVSMFAQVQPPNPVPLIYNPLVPDTTMPGGPAFTLTVNGTGFVSGSTVNWNGSPRATTFINKSQLTATIPATDIAIGGTVSIKVVSPAPSSGTSNVAFFTVTPSAGNLVAFTLSSSTPIGVFSRSFPTAMAVGDFNGDGNMDLAVANCNDYGGPGAVSVFLGDGKGNLTLVSTPTVVTNPFSIAVGDFNGDGKLDLAVAGGVDGTVSILLGDGTGNFTLASSPAFGGRTNSLVTADFNGDGNLDLAIATQAYTGGGWVSMLLGNGMGSLTLFSSIGIGENAPAYSIAAGDFNGDGYLDLAVGHDCYNNYQCAVSILLGDGTGNFTLGSTIGITGLPSKIVAADFNGDGKLDLAVTNEIYNSNTNTISILLGDGTGNFTLASSPVVGPDIYVWDDSLAVGDFNGDGKLDLAVTSFEAGLVSILLGDGTGNFTLASSTPVGASGSYASAVAPGDFNGDGKLDLAVGDYYSGRVSILLNVPVTLSPGSLNFGNQEVDTTTPLTATLTNSSGESLTIDGISIVGANVGDYEQMNNCGASLVAWKSCSIQVTFTPSTLGTRNATLTVTSSDPNSPHTTSLTGVGALPVVQLSATSLNFETQVVKTSGPIQNVTLTNTGGVELTISSISVGGVNSGDFVAQSTCPVPPAKLAVGLACSIGLHFVPTATGACNAAVLITDDATDSPQHINLSGTGQAIPQTITFKNIGVKRYGMAPFALTANASSGLPVTFRLVSGPATVKGNMVTLTGSGVVTIEADQTGNDQYAPASLVQQSLTVRADTLIVTAMSFSVRYGLTTPALTYHVAGFVNGDTSAVLSGAPALTTTAQQVQAVGSYGITITQGTLSSANYQFKFVDGTLKILPAELTVRPNAASAVYGSPLPTLGYTLTGLVNGDTSAVVSGAPMLTTTATQGSPTGSYVITATLGTLSATNYRFSFAPGNLSIRRAELTVKADNKTVAYGAPFPPLTYIITGFVNGDTSSVITGAPALGVKGAAPGSPPGQYEIGVDASKMQAANYFFHAVNGVLTIQ